MKRDFKYLHPDLKLSSQLSFSPDYLLKALCAKHPYWGTTPSRTSLSQKTPLRTNPKRRKNLTHHVHLHIPRDLCPTFSLYKTRKYFQHFGDRLWDPNPLPTRCGSHWKKSLPVSPPRSLHLWVLLLAMSGWMHACICCSSMGFYTPRRYCWN